MQNSKAIKTLILVSQLLLSSILLITSTQANTPILTLADVLDASMQQSNKATNRIDFNSAESYQSSNWLAAFPTIGLNYLDSQDIATAKEQEISINLPFKSPQLRATSKKLSQLISDSQRLQIKKRRLYFSGLLREALWTIRFLEVELIHANEKGDLLEKLSKQYHALLDASEVEHYALLLIQQELSLQQLKISNLVQQRQQWHLRYTNISGLEQLPSQVEENPILTTTFKASNHPFILALENRWKQQQIAFNSRASGENQPWTVSLASRTINTGLFEENQIGISIEIPLTFSKYSSQAEVNSQITTFTDVYMEMDKIQLQLSSQWTQLITQHKNILSQQKLLKQSAILSKQMAEQLNRLHKEGEISHEIWLRRYLQTIDSQTSFAIGKLKNQQIHSMLRQAAGIPL